MYLGIEIGGTKLQLAVGEADGSEPVEIRRQGIVPQQGAAGILEQIKATGAALLDGRSVSRIGIGFGGPVDMQSGRVFKSHQVSGWDAFPLVDWCRDQFGIEAAIANDCDAAALAEARFGAGRGRTVVFYVTVGSGIGGGLVIDGVLYGEGRPSVAEIGHLRPGLDAEDSETTVESLASGWALAGRARDLLADPATGPKNPMPSRADRDDILRRAEGRVERITTDMLAQAAESGNEFARELFREGTRAIGWAIAQMVTLVAPEVIVVGGGVSLAGEELFFGPLRRSVDQYVFPPLAGSYEIVPAQMGELVVVHGALAVAAAGESAQNSKARRVLP